MSGHSLCEEEGKGSLNCLPGGCSCRKDKHPSCTQHCGKGPLCCHTSAPHPLWGEVLGTLTPCEDGTVSYHASHLQDLNPCLLLQLEGNAMDWSCWLCTRLRSAETAAIGSARSHHSSQRLSIVQAGAAWEAVAAAGTGTHHLGVHSRSWVMGVELVMRVLPWSCGALTVPSIHTS